MYVLHLVLTASVGYLSGSVCWAIIITKLVTGHDIRQLGNRNAGTANVGRSVGKGWATIVFFLDLFKALAPLLMARLLVFTGSGYADFLALFAVGMTAILGHCRPLYFSFKGGRGAATSIAVFLFFIPVEIFLAMFLAFILVCLFFRNVEYSIGRWTSVLFVLIVPFLTLGLNGVVGVPLFAHLSFGAHPWYILVGVSATSLFLIFINYPFLKMALGSLFRHRPPEA